MHPGIVVALMIACGGGEPPPAPPEGPSPEAAAQAARLKAAVAGKVVEVQPLKPLPGHVVLFKALPDAVEEQGVTLSEPRIALGRMLYYDARLSTGGDLSCNSCHPLDAWGTDGQTHPGAEGAPARHPPSAYNAALHLAQGWDGAARNVEEQALAHLLDPHTLGMADEAAVVERLSAIEGYVEAFRRGWPDDGQITGERVGQALGAFQRKLLTPGRFDAYLRGDGAALTPEERKGLELFVDTGCATCHVGPAVGGTDYRRRGAVRAYEVPPGPGRFAVTGKDKDKHHYKVASLRNVAETGPWMHDGSVDTLEEAVRRMAYHELGVELPPADVASIVTFLGALTGEVPADYVAAPELPAGPVRRDEVDAPEVEG